MLNNLDDNIIPDGVEPIIAWRAWNVLWPYHLVNLNNHDLWLPRERMEARCIREEHPEGKEIPSIECTCGIYALQTKEEVQKQFPALVYGEVYLWGRIVEFTKGYKAQFAYPKSLYLRTKQQEEILPLVESAYGIPTKMDPWVYKQWEAIQREQSTTMSVDEWLAVALSTTIEDKSIRRFARQQARQRIYMRHKHAEERLASLQAEAVRVEKKIQKDKTLLQALDAVKAQLR